jgi:hypothetical protein
MKQHVWTKLLAIAALLLVLAGAHVHGSGRPGHCGQPGGAGHRLHLPGSPD